MEDFYPLQPAPSWCLLDAACGWVYDMGRWAHSIRCWRREREARGMDTRSDIRRAREESIAKMRILEKHVALKRDIARLIEEARAGREIDAEDLQHLLDDEWTAQWT